MKKNRTYKVNAFLMMLLAGTLSFSATAAASESGLQPAAAAQQQPVKGTIVDVNGNPVPGASVMIPGTTTGTVTQVDGTFSLNVAEGTKVEIGCLGYTTVTTTARNGMKVVLKEDAMMLSDVVVVGYGTQKKANLTGAVASVNVGQALEGRPISDVGRGLQGAAAGSQRTRRQQRGRFRPYPQNTWAGWIVQWGILPSHSTRQRGDSVS